MQLEPGTARSLGVKNPNNLREAANGAAKYLAQFKSRGIVGMLSAYNAGPAGGIQREYVDKTLANAKSYGGSSPTVAIPETTTGSSTDPSKIITLPGAPITQTTFNKAAYQKASSGAAVGKLFTASERADNPLFTAGILSTSEPSKSEYTSTKMPGAPTTRTVSGASGETLPTLPKIQGMSSGSGYVHPVPGFTQERTDQGVDFAGKPGAPIRAIGNGRVLGITSNWYQGQPFVYYELTSGPAKGKVVYVAEQIIPAVRKGDEIRTGQPIGHYASSGTGIETGFATKSGQTLAHATTGYTEGQETRAGKEFAAFLKTLRG
jgi:murein DD-endopeptidase MepM/ murein hydrolase activator NlpD